MKHAMQPVLAASFCAMEAGSLRGAEDCLVCSHPESSVVLAAMKRRLHRCRACGFLYVLPRPSTEELQRVYDEEYFAAGELPNALEFRAPVFEECLERLDRMRPYRGRLLDVGCGTGEFVAAAARRGWNASGIEIAASTAQAARSKGLDVRCCTVTSTPYADNSFDVVSFLDVLEHVAEPMRDLERVHGLLVSGGLIVVRVPNTMFHLAKTRVCRTLDVQDVGLQMDYHLNHFTPKTLTGALRRTGFRMVSLEAGAPETVSYAGWASPWAKGAYVHAARFLKAVTGLHLENVMVAYAAKIN